MEALLRQSSFSEVDRYCSPERQSALVRLVVGFIEHAERAVAAGVAPATVAALRGVAHLKRIGEEHGEGHLDDIAAFGRRLEAELHAAGESDAR